MSFLNQLMLEGSGSRVVLTSYNLLPGIVPVLGNLFFMKTTFCRSFKKCLKLVGANADSWLALSGVSPAIALKVPAKPRGGGLISGPTGHFKPYPQHLPLHTDVV